jgi:hypothetical protein
MLASARTPAPPFFETHRHHPLLLDVDVPAGQLRGQPRVLPAFADGERKLISLTMIFTAPVRFVYLERLSLVAPGIEM